MTSVALPLVAQVPHCPQATAQAAGEAKFKEYHPSHKVNLLRFLFFLKGQSQPDQSWIRSLHGINSRLAFLSSFPGSPTTNIV